MGTGVFAACKRSYECACPCAVDEEKQRTKLSRVYTQLQILAYYFILKLTAVQLLYIFHAPYGWVPVSSLRVNAPMNVPVPALSMKLQK